MSRAEPPKWQNHVSDCVAKSVVRGGELFLSPSFDAAGLVAVEQRQPSSPSRQPAVIMVQVWPGRARRVPGRSGTQHRGDHP